MNNLAEARKNIGITQLELAQSLGWRQSRIANYETGKRIPSLLDSRKLVKALNQHGVSCSLDDIFPSPEA
ncbi:helix-turn-helix transcriptional regulator [Haemophilus paraphrohaemolyticus]|uniref:helix-turn-helix transcriptional regulator n=1 Tax=Haemophilus paraphrohaemolyticus TaxID=736 RepID=UPI000586A907|nr:helix-turn-helix transcriptional regulator [Haemophilus paraphrohaemolyticus]OOR93257.1 transcriptional regulator [Haemophilus paraphrohaemolyticus]STP02058.1 putative zinc finger/helix-turn-helix protein, YgiT family [Haemophilus paraphrohaemolyticus]DAX94380.1 MAG TPA: Helix-turn-helix XRE-family like protein [Bacteriophage sp.]